VVSKMKILKGRYLDSVTLMTAASNAKKIKGIIEAVCIMGTKENISIILQSGVLQKEDFKNVNVSDLIIFLQAETEESLEKAFEEIESTISGSTKQETGTYIPKTLEMADELFNGDLVLISVPGEYAGRCAEKALNLNKHVMIFSDNVPIETEVYLKKKAMEKGLLLMGPDCGTAIISGYALGFANVVKQGEVGVVAASGTGIQEVTSLLSKMNIGISHAIGVGGRDLKEEVGGLSMQMGIELLAKDENTEILVLISKPPEEKVANSILEKAQNFPGPVIVCFLSDTEYSDYANLHFTTNLTDTAAIVAEFFNINWNPVDDTQSLEKLETSPGRKFIRGLYSGGTLCYEALLMMKNKIEIYSNLKLEGIKPLGNVLESKSHTIIDMGEDIFTKGRPHPMIDGTMRKQRIYKEAMDKETAIILVDVVLGYGSHDNPASFIVEAVEDYKKTGGTGVQFVATICGTYDDPQDFVFQKKQLENAGVKVFDSNKLAVTYCLKLLDNIQLKEKEL